jgi:hypothetical protein
MKGDTVMFTYLKLKNFKSFRDTEFDFRTTGGKPNNLIIIYGENGAGKSNLVEAFYFLKDTMYTVRNRNRFEKFKDTFNKEDSREQLLLLEQRIRYDTSNYNLAELVNDVRCIGTKENMEVEYGFNIDGVDGYYRMVFDDEIKEEELYYQISKRRGVHFKITDNTIDLSSTVFRDKNYKEDLIEKIYKYWGKNTFLSILFYEMIHVNKEYLYSRVDENIFKVLDFFGEYYVRFNNMGSKGQFATKYDLLMDLDSNRLTKVTGADLSRKEELLKYFFTNLYSDIKDVHYKVDYDSQGKVSDYSLYVKKMIGGELRDINFKYESTGTKHVLNLLLPLVEACTGNTAIIDEADTGIHDILFNKLILSAKDCIKGQLIITTHNTTLLETIPKEHIYFIVIDINGEKRLFNVRDYDVRTKSNHNIRDRYIKGLYGGVPVTGYFDFEDLLDILNGDYDE